jgi:phospholipid-binding lipoprotein MlaA
MVRNHLFNCLVLSLLLLLTIGTSTAFAARAVLAPPAKPIVVEGVDPLLPPADHISNIDPYEHYNRNTYRLNEKLDRIILKPVAEGYKAVTPSFFREGTSNFFNNLAEIPRFANDVLQGNFYWAMNDMWRFVINTTVGIGGVFDVAKKTGLQTHRNSFSFTLESWGAKPSPYTMLPLLGPSVLYNVYGLPMDYELNPLSSIGGSEFSTAMFMLNVINMRARFLQNEDLLDQVSVDDYVFFRNAYLQARAKQLSINQHPPLFFTESNPEEELYTEE